MINAIRTDLRKNILSFRFVIGCAVILILLLSTNCVVDPGLVVPAYSYPLFLIKTGEELWLSTPLYCDIFMFVRAFQNEWLAVFLPVLTGISCVPSLCDEINSNNFRINISRIGFGNYIVSKFVSAFITAFAMMLVVCVVFGIFCIAAFSSPNEFYENTSLSDNGMLDYYRHLTSFSDYPMNALFHSQSRMLAALSRFITITLYAALPCEIAMLFGTITCNKFVALSVPVMCYFGIEQAAISIEQKVIEKNGKTPPIWFFDFHARYYEGERFFSKITGLPAFVFYLYPTVLIFFVGIAFFILLKRRVCS